MSGIATETSQDVDGNENIGWVDDADWMSYQVNVPTTGDYIVSYCIASEQGGKLSLEKAGGSVNYGTLDIPATNGWQNWQTISHRVSLNTGSQQIAITALTGGWNIN